MRVGESSLDAVGHAGDKDIVQFDKYFSFPEGGNLLRIQQQVLSALHIHENERVWLAPKFRRQILDTASGDVCLDTIDHTVEP